MFKFSFSNEKIISKNTSSFPIVLDDVKSKSFFYIDNPTDTTEDDFVNNFLIPTVIEDWEESTHYLLLDQTLKNYVPDIGVINNNSLEICLNYLNIREVESIKYYPDSWNEIDPKLLLDVGDYNITEELLNITSKLKLKKTVLPLVFFNIKNNLESQIKAGFLDNDFSSMDSEIKQGLAMQVATAIDIKNGYCSNYYSDRIESIYAKYSIQKQLISFI